MPRRLVSTRVEVQQEKRRQVAAAQVASMVGPKRKAPRGGGKAQREAHLKEIERRAKGKDWDGVTAGKLVALYYFCHVRVYQVPPIELQRNTTYTAAMKQAGSMVKRHFDGDVQKAVRFMRWVWDREQGKQEWLKTNDKEGRRLTWQNQFTHDFLVTDWLRAKAQKANVR